MLKKISLSSAAALLLTAQALADTSSYRIFLGAYAGSTEKLISSATPKLSGVDGISKIITEYRNDKTYVFVNVLEEGEVAAKKMLAIVKEKTGIDDAYCLPVRSKSKKETFNNNKENFVIPSYNFINIQKHQEAKNEKNTANTSKKNAGVSILKDEKVISGDPAKPGIVVVDSNKEEIEEKFPVVLIVKSPTTEEEIKNEINATKTTQKVVRARKFDPSFKTVKIERAKELSEIIGNTKLEKTK